MMTEESFHCEALSALIRGKTPLDNHFRGRQGNTLASVSRSPEPQTFGIEEGPQGQRYFDSMEHGEVDPDSTLAQDCATNEARIKNITSNHKGGIIYDSRKFKKGEKNN
ncbi:MAG: hypothetical protein HN696_00795 [Euryarchaeota archaeon]|jgi:hypothetical protein|nr:hypothetical protein [Euryarchaeota archaeon]